MSAFGGKADIDFKGPYFCFRPFADIAAGLVICFGRQSAPLPGS
jgi:hypothetical protein